MENPIEITLHLTDIKELLHTTGVGYRKRTLHPDAEEFIIEEAEMLPHKGSIQLIVHIPLSQAKHKGDIAKAIHQHFAYRRVQSRKQIKRSITYGWRMLIVALALLVFIFTLTEIGSRVILKSGLAMIIRESFIILGWVALWRPMELLLYDWYPIKKDETIFRRLEESNVEVILRES